MPADTITAADREAATGLLAFLQPHIIAAWHASPEAGPKSAVVAGYLDHAVDALRVEGVPRRPGRVGVGIYGRLVVLDALARRGEDDLAQVFRYCDPGVIPVMLCAGTHVAMVYLHPMPAEVVTVGRGGDA